MQGHAQFKFLPLITTMLIILVALGVYGQTSPVQEDFSGDSGAPVSTSISSEVSFGHDGLILTDENNSTHLRVHGYVQADGRFFSSDLKDHSPDKLFFRRIRPIFQGTLFNTVNFYVMPDFGQNNPQIQDAYMELKLLSFAKARVGKFKTPVGLEDLRPDTESSFSERSLASDLVPLREVGVQVGGALLRDSISYAVGYFNGTTDGSNGNFQWRASNEGVARIFLQPFITGRAKPLRSFGVGVGGSFADDRGRLPSFKTAGQNTFFKYSSKALAGGQHNRLSPQAWYYCGPAGLIGEYNISSQQVRNGLHELRLSNVAWQATASLMLTGEKNSYAGVRPRYAFEPQQGIRHLGGWELAARYSRLRVDGEAFPVLADPKISAAGACEWGIGLNWYPNGFVKIMNDYENTRFQMAWPTLASLHGEHVVMSRIQLAF